MGGLSDAGQSETPVVPVSLAALFMNKKIFSGTVVVSSPAGHRRNMHGKNELGTKSVAPPATIWYHASLGRADAVFTGAPVARGSSAIFDAGWVMRFARIAERGSARTSSNRLECFWAEARRVHHLQLRAQRVGGLVLKNIPTIYDFSNSHIPAPVITCHQAGHHI